MVLVYGEEGPRLYDASYFIGDALPVWPGASLDDGIFRYALEPRGGPLLAMVRATRAGVVTPLYALVPMPAPPDAYLRLWVEAVRGLRACPGRLARRVGDEIRWFGEEVARIDVITADRLPRRPRGPRARRDAPSTLRRERGRAPRAPRLVPRLVLTRGHMAPRGGGPRVPALDGRTPASPASPTSLRSLRSLRSPATDAGTAGRGRRRDAREERAGVGVELWAVDAAQARGVDRPEHRGRILARVPQRVGPELEHEPAELRPREHLAGPTQRHALGALDVHLHEVDRRAALRRELVERHDRHADVRALAVRRDRAVVASVARRDVEVDGAAALADGGGERDHVAPPGVTGVLGQHGEVAGLGLEREHRAVRPGHLAHVDRHVADVRADVGGHRAGAHVGVGASGRRPRASGRRGRCCGRPSGASRRGGTARRRRSRAPSRCARGSVARRGPVPAPGADERAPPRRREPLRQAQDRATLEPSPPGQRAWARPHPRAPSSFVVGVGVGPVVVAHGADRYPLQGYPRLGMPRPRAPRGRASRSAPAGHGVLSRRRSGPAPMSRRALPAVLFAAAVLAMAGPWASSMRLGR